MRRRRPRWGYWMVCLIAVALMLYFLRQNFTTYYAPLFDTVNNMTSDN